MTRRLAWKLLAPTVIVSLLLVGASIAGIVYLNNLHLHVARDLSENVESTQVAARLETTTQRLVILLRSKLENSDALYQQVVELNQDAYGLIQDANRLANLDREQVLVAEIMIGFQEYETLWKNRTRKPAELARELEKTVLKPCEDLRHFNTDQIEETDRNNRKVVSKLRWGMLAVGLVLPLGGLVLGYAVARSLRHSIYQLSVRIRDAAGRLNKDLGSVTLEEEGDLPDLHQQMQGISEEIESIVKKLQQREREVLRAEQLAAVGQVAAGVAHELRNPLTSIKMLVQTGLEGDKAAGLPPEDLSIIEHEIRRMEDCIRQFLDFARPPRSERRRTDLTDVVRRALALVDGRAHRQKVELASDLPSDPVLVEIDPEQIHQVLVNLLLNALDAMPRGGTGLVTLDKTEDLGGHGFFVEIRVRDTGPGIAPRIRERLFEPFVSSKETGLGLGLSICKRLVEAHGGDIHGDNLPGGGAIFSFRLPAEEQSVQCSVFSVQSNALSEH